MLSDSHFAHVIYTLRIADAYFFAEARRRRISRNPTHHAKQRASKLGLQVNTDKAARLSIKEVSTKPYPVITQTYSPVIESNIYISTTSWVTGPTASDLLNVGAALSEHLTRAQQLTQNEFADLLMHPSCGYDTYTQIHRPLPDVPSEARPDWEGDILQANSTTSTSRSSSMIATPEDQQEVPLKIHMNSKRKSCEVDDNVVYVEKRPKYGRKNWVLTLRQTNV